MIGPPALLAVVPKLAELYPQTQAGERKLVWSVNDSMSTGVGCGVAVETGA